ncbi:MAG: insulinase family protein [Saprospiraceae bacterium]|nr:insulinase family protein [Saprospiraceae bacterium]
MRINTLILAFAAILLGNVTMLGQKKAIQKLPEGIEKVASVEGITEYLLTDNGLRILLFPDNSKSTITVNVTYLVGSRHEGYGETGMAHLLEHLVFKGTPDHPNIPQELTEHGARPNGSTSVDRTNYFETFAATEENLKWALDLESDRMVNSFIAKKDLDSEMTVVRNEFESGENNPSNILRERIYSSAFLWHNYGKSTIGARSDIEQVPIERLQAFYRKYYQPDNAILTVSGKIDPAETLALIKGYFGEIPRPKRELYKTYTVEPTQDGERTVSLRRTGEVQVVACAYHTAPASHPDNANLDVLMDVLTNEPSGRLYKALVEPGLAASQFGYVRSMRESGLAYFSANVLKEKSLEEAQNAMVATLDAIAETAPTEEEVERAKTGLLNDIEQLLKDSDRLGLIISEFIAMGDWRLGFLYRDQLKKVTLEDVVRVSKKYFKPTNRTIGRFIPVDNPDRVEIPATPDIAAMVANYKGGEVVSEGEEFDPSPANINSRTTMDEIPNSLEYAFLPKETRGDVVMGRMTLRFGNAKTLSGKSTIASLTAAMIDKGMKRMDRQEIKDELDRLKARVNVFGGGGTAGAMIQTERDNLAEVITLLGEMLKTPTFPEDEFEKLKQARIAAIENQKSDPQGLAVQKLQRLMNDWPENDVRYSMTFDEQLAAIKAVTIDDVKKFHKEYYGATDGTVSIVGDFDNGVAKKALAKSFKDWKSPKSYTRLKDRFYAPKPSSEVINTPDKQNAFFIAAQNLEVGEDHPDYAAMMLGNYMLGGGFLNSRLATRIRQKEGLSYGVGSQFRGDALDPVGSWLTYAIYSPDNAAKLEKAFREEMEKVAKDGFTAEEVEAAKSGWLQSQEVSRAQDGALAAKLNSYLFLDRDMNYDAELEKKIAALTPAQINKAMKKHLDVNKMVMIKAGDFEKASKSDKP